MTKAFLINVTVDDPFPKYFEYREKAGKIEVAIARALRNFRRDEWKGRPLTEIKVKATAASAVSLEKK